VHGFDRGVIGISKSEVKLYGVGSAQANGIFFARVSLHFWANLLQFFSKKLSVG